ncbi:hypothetical protein [Niabella ginsengisoli]|uniref:Glycosyltransferase family 1 protein n=1 Tax=Niabella ginsengisoli TaxID=522298 RepID=A0ABS9SQH5_9BACT|nr:hypothetical protein [Niabella ginsengisoli]MCH5600625.1 hypothetical protein [Niabella ginsengisoli]
MNKRIVFTITGDMLYDQRMQKVCGTLADSGYDVLLLGFKKTGHYSHLPNENFNR